MSTVESIDGTGRRVAVNLDACIECHTCAAACFYGHNELPALQRARVGATMLPAMCRQCADAPCVTACPAGAMLRDANEAVYRAVFRCQGCGACVLACPFGVLTADTFNGQIARCDLCRDELAQERVPRCVQACPSGALQFIEAPEAEAMGLVVLGSRTLGQDPIRRR